MVDIKIEARDQVMAKFGNALAALGEKDATRIISMALNKEGDKGRTQIRRELMAQTGIKSHQINKAVKTIKAGANNLRYTIEAKGDETNISMFGLKVAWKTVGNISSRFINAGGKHKAHAGKMMKVQEVTASPWNQTRTFPGAFSVPKFGGKVFKRMSSDRFPLRAVFGPNIARELTKAESAAEFEKIMPKVVDEVGRLLGLVLSGDVKLGGRGY